MSGTGPRVKHELSQGILSTAPQDSVADTAGVSPSSFLMGPQFEVPICPVEILDIPASFAGRVGHPVIVVANEVYDGVTKWSSPEQSPKGHRCSWSLVTLPQTGIDTLWPYMLGQQGRRSLGPQRVL